MTPDDDVYYKKKIIERRARMAEQMQISDREAKKEMCNYEQLQRVWNFALFYLLNIFYGPEFLQAWSVNRCVSKEDWVEWLRRFSIQLMAESPYAALRSCHGVAQNYAPLAKYA